MGHCPRDDSVTWAGRYTKRIEHGKDKSIREESTRDGQNIGRLGSGVNSIWGA